MYEHPLHPKNMETLSPKSWFTRQVTEDPRDDLPDIDRGPVLGGSKAAYRAQAIMEMRIRNGVRKFAPKHWIIVCHDNDGYDYHRRRGYNAATVLALAKMVTCTLRGIVYD